MSDVVVPQYHELMWPALEAVKALGGSATINEMNERVVNDRGFTEEQQSVMNKRGRMPELAYRLHWARTHLKGIGALENKARGVWTLTPHGRELSREQMQKETTAWRASLRASRSGREQGISAVEPDGDSPGDWKDRLLDRLCDLSPDGFERLTQLLLRTAGFVNVEVTGRSGDGGIDGVGLYRLSLVSFPVYFQCKKYRGSVRAGAVRDFRGAMAGRGEKGLLVTTGVFTRDAIAEASRDGAPGVELIDGDRLCELLKDNELGVTIKRRIEEDVAVDDHFFDDY